MFVTSVIEPPIRYRTAPEQAECQVARYGTAVCQKSVVALLIPENSRFPSGEKASG